MIKPLLAATVVALASSIAPWAAVAQPAVRVAVTYAERPCGMPAQLAQSAPVTAGTLEVRRGAGAPVPVTLGAAPASSVALPGSGLLAATLILATPRVKVVSGAAGSTPIAINLGFAVSRGSVETFVVPSQEDHHNGSIHALIQLERAADVAEQANGAPLPQLTARVFEGPAGVPSDTQFDTPAAINVVAVAGSDDRWEPTPLLHEYGHFVLQQVAPGGPLGDAHSIATSYPEWPDLAWTEGFPSAFAAVVTRPEWKGKLKYKCGPYQSLDDVPPLATRRDKRYAQYNESRVAAVAYQLTERRGGGVQGLKDLLDAMKIYRRDAHNAWTARDLRDLAVQAFENNSAADHAAIDEIFAAQGMNWAQSFGFEVDGSEDYGIWADQEIMLRIAGPAGFDCRTTRDIYETKLNPLDGGRGVVKGVKVASGPLGYSENDDCYLISGDGVVGQRRPKARTMGIDAVEVPFPYLGGLDHWTGPYTLTAKYVCARDAGPKATPGFRCPDTFNVQLRVWNSQLIFNEPSLLQPIPVTLVKDVDMPVVIFKANGECKAFGGVDCGF